VLLSGGTALCYNSGRPYSGAVFWVDPLGRGAMVAQRTLDPLILVRIRAPQLDRSLWIGFVLDDDLQLSIIHP
jgi:hypothetical protein